MKCSTGRTRQAGDVVASFGHDPPVNDRSVGLSESLMGAMRYRQQGFNHRGMAWFGSRQDRMVQGSRPSALRFSVTVGDAGQGGISKTVTLVSSPSRSTTTSVSSPGTVVSVWTHLHSTCRHLPWPLPSCFTVTSQSFLLALHIDSAVTFSLPFIPSDTTSFISSTLFLSTHPSHMLQDHPLIAV
jgi:hypothetical protein